jgi:hypothetical protein
MAIGGWARKDWLEEAVRTGKASVESFHHFLAHFVAAGMNGWPQQGDQRERIRAEGASHVPHGFLDHSRQCPAPTGMDGCHSAPLRVHQ